MTWKVQVSYTFEWVTHGVYDTWGEAEEAASALIEEHGEDRVRVIES